MEQEDSSSDGFFPIVVNEADRGIGRSSCRGLSLWLRMALSLQSALNATLVLAVLLLSVQLHTTTRRLQALEEAQGRDRYSWDCKSGLAQRKHGNVGHVVNNMRVTIHK